MNRVRERYALPNDAWGSLIVGVELTGAEWFTVIAQIGGYRKQLSPEGKEVAVRAVKRLLAQITASSEKFRALNQD